MRYTFKDLLNPDLYTNTCVIFTVGKYTIFNNMVADTFKHINTEEDTNNNIVEFAGEFGLDSQLTEQGGSNSVDFNTFMDVVGVPSINGKWYCRTDLAVLNKKQKEKLINYIKNPSDTGILIITSTEWQVYKEFVKNRTIGISKVCHIIQLSFPHRPTLKQIVKQMFDEKGLEVDSSAIDLFIIRLSDAYDDYETTIQNIKEEHKEGKIDSKLMKDYLKGIENYVLDDYLEELTKPLSSALTNNKKVLRMMVILEDDIGAKNLVYQLLKKINECIEYRILINNGYIPIGINYFFKDVINDLPDKEKYKDVKEWTFRKKAQLAASTSIKDWEYMRIILNRAIENVRVSDDVLDKKCQKALYEISTRTVLTDNRLDNILGFDNILYDDFNKVNRIVYNDNTED